MEAPALVRYRLHPAATFMRDVGYVFIDLEGRLFRMNESEFHAFCERCAQGAEPSQMRAFQDLLIATTSETEAIASFQHQELPPHGH